MVARLGGDEFVIVQAEGSQPEAAEMLADHLVEMLCAQYRIFDSDVAIGIAICGGAALGLVGARGPRSDAMMSHLT